MKTRLHPQEAYKLQKRIRLTDDHLRQYLGSDLLTRLARTPLVVGSQTFTSRQLAVALGVTNTLAAARLSKVAETIGAKDVRDLYDRTSPYALARLDHVGKFTVYVALKLFESQGLDSRAWFGRLPEGETMAIFDTIKRREAVAATRTKKGKR